MHDIAVVRAVAAMDAADAGGEQLLVTLGKVLMSEARPRQQPGEFDLVVLGDEVWGVRIRDVRHGECARRGWRGQGWDEIECLGLRSSASAGSTRQISTSSANLNSDQYSDS